MNLNLSKFNYRVELENVNLLENIEFSYNNHRFVIYNDSNIILMCFPYNEFDYWVERECNYTNNNLLDEMIEECKIGYKEFLNNKQN